MMVQFPASSADEPDLEASEGGVMSLVARWTAAAAATILGILVLAMPGVADASTVTVTITANVLNVRDCPWLMPMGNCPVQFEVYYGARMTVSEECMYGSPVYGDRKWDFAYDGFVSGWFSDYYTRGDHSGHDPGVPEVCD